MKMFKLMGKRGFAVFTSLALCAGLVAPSFAATFSELQNAVNGSDGIYGVNQDITRAGDKITLNGDVTRGVGEEDAIGISSKVTIDLNGHTIDGTKNESTDRDRVVLRVDNGGDLTVTDGSENGNGTITGGSWGGVRVWQGGAFTLNGGTISGNTSAEGNRGGVHVEEGGSFTMNGGEISGNAGGGVRVDGTNSTFTMNGGAITGNSINEAGAGGGGVYVTNGGKFAMTDGTISGNTAAFSGGGVGVKDAGSSFTMSGGVISGNTAENKAGNIAGNGGGGGGGVWIKSGAEFTMSGGEITGNSVVGESGNGGGVAIHQGTFTMTNGTIANNDSARGTGVLINARGEGDATFTMTGGYTSGKDDTSCIWLEEDLLDDHNAKFELSGDAIMDGSIRLGQGTQVVTENVKKNGDPHELTGFKATNEKTGGEMGSVTPESTEGGSGYEAEADTLLDVKYEHEWDRSKWAYDSKYHGYKCEHCSAMTDTALHNWDEGKVTKAATCTNTGKMTYTCTVCGYTKTEDIKATGHEWDDGEVTTEATCTADGVKTFTCTACGTTNPETEAVSVDPNNHTGVGGFTPNGDNHHKVCSDCKTEVETGSHSWNEGDWSDWAPTGDGETEAQTRTDTCNVCGATDTKTNTQPIPATGDNDNGGDDDDDDTTDTDDPDVPLASFPDEVEIDEPEVPLAGLITRADVIGYLWEKSGRPDAALSDFPDVPGDHEWAVAIGWAQDAGIAVADVDGNFRPDDLVLRSVEDIKLSPEGELEQFLNRYAVYAGIKLEKGELFIALDGEWDEIIMGEDAQIILDQFFAKLEQALAGQAA